ncbi:MAG: cytochrome c oxidase assembly protein [Candidatus Rokuibacteriota bacterium]
MSAAENLAPELVLPVAALAAALLTPVASLGHVLFAAHGPASAVDGGGRRSAARGPVGVSESYAAAPRVAGLTALEDQALGGVIMWAAGATVHMLAVLALVWRLLAALEHAAGATRAELGAIKSRV